MGVTLSSVTTTSALAAFDTESVVVSRRSVGSTPGTFVTTTIFSGVGDFQGKSGDSFMSPSGTAETADASLDLEPIAGALPSVEVGDLVVFNAMTYTVAMVSPWTFPIAHLSLLLKRGEQQNKPRK